MKKLLLAVTIVCIFATLSFAVDSTQTVSKQNYGSSMRGVKISWTASDAGAYTAYALPAEILDYIRGWWLCQLITNPGSTAPADNYGITLVNADSADILGGGGTSRDTSNSEVTYPIVDANTTQRACVPVTSSSLTFTLTSVTNASCTGTVEFIFVKPTN